MANLISIRLGDKLDQKLRKLAQAENEDKSTLIRELLEKGIIEKNIEHVLEQYKQGKITLWKAARLAGVSLWRMIDIIGERKLELQYGEKELYEDLEPLIKKKKV